MSRPVRTGRRFVEHDAAARHSSRSRIFKTIAPDASREAAVRSRLCVDCGRIVQHDEVRAMTVCAFGIAEL